MNMTTQKLGETLNNIEKLIEEEELQELYNLYIDTDNNIKGSECFFVEENREMIAQFYASFAYFLFSCQEYEDFYRIYIEAQDYGYPSEKRRKFIYEAFIEPNLDDFRTNYITNQNKLITNGCLKKTLMFEELPYWLLLSGNQNEYYLYDKKTNLIRDKITWSFSKELLKSERNSFSKENDQLIIRCETWKEFQGFLIESTKINKKIYFSESNTEKIISCLQGGLVSDVYFSNIIMFEKFNDFREYFMIGNHFLPRKIIAFGGEKSKYEEVIEEIHQFRLKKENRSGNNVLLSICIPSYNRGHRAYNNVIHALKSDLDEEIEVVVSNNGTQNESKDFYQKINEIQDSRLTYFEFNENQGLALNFSKVIDLAKGKFVLMISDEDFVNLNELNSLINILRNIEKSNISLIRTKTDGQGVVPFIGLAEPGVDSLLKFMLTSNYLSGIIYNKEIFTKYNLLGFMKDNLENEICVYYPHMAWELLICQYGGALGLDIILINEGQEEYTKHDLKEIGTNDKIKIPYYRTIEGRLAQHEGFFDIIKEMKISKNDFDVFRALYKKLCLKTFFLVSLSFDVSYKETDVCVKELLRKVYEETVKCINKMYYGKKNRNANKYADDVTELKKIYQCHINLYFN